MVADVQKPISIPEPTNDVDSLWASVKALKEAVETMQGIRGMREYALLADVLNEANDLQEQIKAIEVVAADGATQLNELSDVNTSTPTNRFALVADGVDFESRLLVEADISDLSPSVGVAGLGVWRYRTEITAPPASGQIRFDNADVSLATEFYLHETTDEGTDVSSFLELLLQDGSALYMQDKTNAANHVIIEISTSADSGTYRTYGIESISESGAEPGQNTQVILVTGGVAGGIAPGTSTDNALRWNGSAWVEVSGHTIGSTGAITALTYGGILESNLTNAGGTELITGEWSFSGNLNVNGNAFFVKNAGLSDWARHVHNGVDYITDFTLTADWEIGSGLTGVILVKAPLSLEDATTGNTIKYEMLSTGYLDITSALGTPISIQHHGNFSTRFFSPDDTNYLQIQVTDGGLASFSQIGLTSFVFDNYEFDTDQVVGAGQDNFVLTYDDADGQISLEAGATSIADGTVTNNALRWNGTAWVEVSGHTIGSTGAITALTYGGILEGNLTNAGASQLITGAWNFTGSTDFWGGVNIGNAGQTDFIRFSHNGVDFNMAGTLTADINITGITAINAGTVDADFDVLTATSFGGVASANLLDKAADEIITGKYLFTDTPDPAPAALQSALTANFLHIDGKEAIDGADAWLRLNQNGEFANGIFTPNLIRTDGGLQVGSSSTAGLYINSTETNVQWKGLGIARWGTSGQTQSSMTISTSVASGGSNGDIHFRY